MRKLGKVQSECFREKCQRIMSGEEVRFILACIATFALHCRFEIATGEFIGYPILNGVNKLSNTFMKPEFTDIIVLAAVYLLLRFVAQKDRKLDFGTLIFSMMLSTILLFAISFRKFNSAVLVFGNKYQVILSVFCMVGFCIILYTIIRCVYFQLQKGFIKQETNTFLDKYFFTIGFCIILLGWLPWITMNYPGSGCPDSVKQLKEFLGDEPWNVGHPPLSTFIMGSLFTLGRWIVDSNFGFFLYCLMQTCVGAWVFSLSMRKLQKLGVPIKICMMGILFFALTPLWGTYAQWVEKDLLYAEVTVLQAVCMLDILVKKQCEKKDALLLSCVSLVTVLLRHNGIYAVLPTLILLTVWLKGVSRRRAAVALLTTMILYEGIMEGLYPALGMGKTSVAEPLSIPFQQTARYVCEHGDEVTEHERAAIEGAFVSYDIMFHYDPLISDPIKIYCTGENLGEYFKVWFQMLFKHPETYAAAFFNMGYGYLAPVSQKIEAWVQRAYFDYMTEIGLHHTLDMKYHHILAQIWDRSMTLPLIQYLASPGFYTWIVLILMAVLIKGRRYKALILFVPGLVNILVCLASPVAGTIRYALPTVAVVPLLIGWTWYMMHEHEIDNKKSL